MLPIKTIKRIRFLYFDEGYSANDIAKKCRCTPNTVYRYIKMVDFSPKPKIKHTFKSKIIPYIPLIKQWLEDDRQLHHKQRHNALRVHERLQEEFSGYNISYTTLNYHFQKLRKEVFHHKQNYLPLSHIPGEAQVDFGMCSFYEGDIPYKGYFLVVAFPYSNASFCQFFKAKNAECLLHGLKNIFECIGGVPHTDWFDNDTAIVKVEYNPEITKSIHELFARFQMHYDFNEVFCSPHAPNEKGVVENAVKYLRNKLLVPVPHFKNIDEYNNIILYKCTQLMNRKHYKRKALISELWQDDVRSLYPLPTVIFDVATIRKRKCSAMGCVATDNNRFSYYIGPTYAYKTIQLRQTYNEVELIDVYGNSIITYPRLYGKPGQECIHWENYLPTMIEKPKSLNNSRFTELLSKEFRAFLLEKSTRRKKHIQSIVFKKIFYYINFK